MNSGKKWSIYFMIISFTVFIFIGIFTFVIDPYFHFSGPHNGLEYPINNHRYQNDGIVRNFEYDAIIIGTSMIENFKTSECDDIFDVNSIKVPFSSASLKEINDNLKRALTSNDEIKLVIRGIDNDKIQLDKDVMTYSSYPTYLTDDIFINDIKYILNKRTLLDSINVLLYTMNGKKTTTFDQYSNFTSNNTYNKMVVLNGYSRKDKDDSIKFFDSELKKRTLDNLNQNVLDITKQYPEIQFYYFFPPYSIAHWDKLNQAGSLNLYIDLLKFSTELMLEQENIHVFAFFDEYDIITDLNNYKDIWHYHESVNTKMLYWMGSGKHQLTKENYVEYWNDIYEYYANYDYDSIFE